MNSNYIHLRVNDLYIYIYRRGRIYKDQPKKYNNKKTNTYLIPFKINNTEFGEVKLMMSASLSNNKKTNTYLILPQN
jgi:hypothetical protein